MAREDLRAAVVLRALTVGFLAIGVPAASFAADGDTGTIRGIVLETQGGAPVDKVLVRLQDTGRTVTTDDAGRFEIDEVSAGRREISENG